MRQIVVQYIQSERTEILRVKKIKAMQEFLEAFDIEQPLTLAEIQEFIQEIKLRQPVFEKLIYPVLIAAVEAGNLASIKLMLKPLIIFTLISQGEKSGSMIRQT